MEFNLVLETFKLAFLVIYCWWRKKQKKKKKRSFSVLLNKNSFFVDQLKIVILVFSAAESDRVKKVELGFITAYLIISNFIIAFFFIISINIKCSLNIIHSFVWVWNLIAITFLYVCVLLRLLSRIIVPFAVHKIPRCKGSGFWIPTIQVFASFSLVLSIVVCLGYGSVFLFFWLY